MLIHRPTLNQAVNDLWGFFLNTEKSWVNKLYRWLIADSDFIFDDYVKYLVSLKQQTFVQEVNFWVRLFKNMGFNVTDFEVRFWKKEGAEIQPCSKSARIPTADQIKTLINSLENREQLFMLILENSGRRSVDITRIRSNQVKTIDSKFFATIPRDKTHLSQVTFSWEWNLSYLEPFQSIESVENSFRTLLAESPTPFANIRVNKIRKSITWRLHGLRHRRAIVLLRSGVSSKDTMSSIGWACESSLFRYTKLPLSDLKNFENSEDCIKFINS